MVIAMAVGLTLIALAVTGWMLRVVRERDPVERAWLAFCKRLARAGAARAPYEGPLDYARRALAQWRERTDAAQLAAIQAIAEGYALLRYGPKPDKVRVEQFTHLVRNFRL